MMLLIFLILLILMYLLLLVAPQGFEPRYSAPEADVLPLNEGAMLAARVEIDVQSDPLS
jgi:hypothetical protein